MLAVNEEDDKNKLRESMPSVPFKAKDRIQDMRESDRPREKLARSGAHHLTDAELLAIFFRIGIRGKNAITMSRELIEKYGSLQALSRLTVDQLSKTNKGIGPAKAAELVAVFEMGRRLAAEQLEDVPLNQPDRVYALLASEMQQLQAESLRVLLLNTRLRLVKAEEISRGSISETVAHPRDILHPVLLHRCHGFVLVHNHPSGDPEPSSADRTLTRRVREAADLMRVEMLDHIIIGHPSVHGDAGPGYFSFKEHGLL
jgi:DNA repair protein RadC